MARSILQGIALASAESQFLGENLDRLAVSSGLANKRDQATFVVVGTQLAIKTRAWASGAEQ